MFVDIRVVLNKENAMTEVWINYNVTYFSGITNQMSAEKTNKNK